MTAINSNLVELLLAITPLLGLWLLLGLVGCVIGNFHGRPAAGFFLGFILGPIGWLLVLLLKRGGRKCPACLCVVHDQAVRCRHCGKTLPPAIKRGFVRRVI